MEQDFTPEVCLAWIRSVPGAERSVVTHATTLKTIFEDCMGLGWLRSDLANPMGHPLVAKALRRLREQARDHRVVAVLSVEQVHALLATATTKIPDYRRIRYLIALATGLRDHEIQGLVWGDLDLDAEMPLLSVDRQLEQIGPSPFVHVRELERKGLSKDEIAHVEQAVVSDPKRKSVRKIPLLPLAVEVLQWWKTTGWRQYVGRAPKQEDPVFPSGKGNRHSAPGQFCFVESAVLLRKDLERVGQSISYRDKPVNFHSLRRTFATFLNENGVSEADVGDLLGHGAKSVARGHYISPDVFERRIENLRRLPLPKRLQLRGTSIGGRRRGRGAVVDLSPEARTSARKRSAQ